LGTNWARDKPLFDLALMGEIELAVPLGRTGLRALEGRPATGLLPAGAEESGLEGGLHLPLADYYVEAI
jgi:hypothetical protein